MQNIYYMRLSSVPLVLALLAIPGGRASAKHQSSARLRTSALDSHEGMTISAEPWTSAEQYKSKFRKKSPLSAGILAIHVTFRNDTDDSLKIGLKSIRLMLSMGGDQRQELQTLSPEELADAVLRPGAKDPSASRAPFPLPFPTSSGGRNKKWQELEKAARDASVQDSVVAPHKTVDGLLYFDIQGQFDLLSSAHLSIPDVVSLENNHPLLFFDIDLSRAAQQ
jgi:hypothetical protein